MMQKHTNFSSEINEIKRLIYKSPVAIPIITQKKTRKIVSPPIRVIKRQAEEMIQHNTITFNC